MPFKSEAQRRFLWAKHPEIAQRWAKEEKMDPVKKTAHRLGQKKSMEVKYARPKRRSLGLRKLAPGETPKQRRPGRDGAYKTAENRRPARAKFHSYTQPKLGGHIPYWLRNKRKKSGPGHP